MLGKVLIFGVGTVFGAYVMENYLYRKITNVIIEHVNTKNEKKTSETKES